MAAVIGQSKVFLDIIGIADMVARSPSCVLITGKSGTGKEVLARYIHKKSSRSNRPFVAENIPSIPKELIISTLLGYKKGAFTGANENKEGLIKSADGGTFLLDEIGDLPLEAQVQLLRVIETGEFFPVGGTQIVKTNVRFIATTNCNLEEKVRNGTFRMDLFQRLDVLRIHMPPLTKRQEDIIPLANHFIEDKLKELGSNIPVTLSRDAKKMLRKYDWPGNVRELKNLIARALTLCGDHSKPITLEPYHFNFSGETVSEILERPKEQSFREKAIGLLTQCFDDLEKMNSFNLSSVEKTIHHCLIKAAFQIEETNMAPELLGMNDADFLKEISEMIKRSPKSKSQKQKTDLKLIKETESEKDVEKNKIITILNKNRGNVKQSARDLGIGYEALRNKVRKYQLKEYANKRNKKTKAIKEGVKEIEAI